MMLYLVCEGPGDGLDVRVLDLILAQKLQLLVRIEPAGGDSSLRSVARYLEERHRDARAHSIADRNYTPLTRVEALWNDPQSRDWMWRRHEIENYLLQPEILSTMVAGWQALGIRGSAKLPTAVADIWDWLRKIATRMLADHAGYVTLHSIKGEQQRRDTRWLDPTDTTLERLPGTPYADRDAWMRYLENESRRLRQACQSFDDAAEFSPGTLLQRYDKVLAQISAPAFMEKDFLSDMAGHELLWGVCRAISEAGGSLSLKQLPDELVRAFDAAYHETLFDPNDFQNLGDRLRNIRRTLA